MTHNNGDYSAITPEIDVLAQKMTANSIIDTELYSKYNVKRGLRDIDGKGVLTGLTDISAIIQNKTVDGKVVPCEGELYYRGYNVNDIIKGITDDDRFGFEEVVYLLLFGSMPTAEELKNFKNLLVQYRTLPQNFVRDVILKAPSDDMMNSIARSVLTLFCYDDNPNDTSIENVLRQCIQLISQIEKPIVKSAKVYLLYGDLSDAEIAEIKKYVINPVEAREASLEKADTLKIDYDIPTSVDRLDGFCALDDGGLKEFIAKHGLAMDFDDIKFCQDYFKSENRDPFITEIKMIDTYWSDHCRHTTFATELT